MPTPLDNRQRSPRKVLAAVVGVFYETANS